MYDNSYVYLQFPLYLVRGLFTDKENTINDMINYGIYFYSLQNESTPENVARQLIYDMYRNNLSNQLLAYVQMYIDSEKLQYSEDYKGFDNDGKFDPIFEKFDVEQLFQENPDFFDLACEHFQLHRIKATGKPLKIKIRSNFSYIKDRAIEIEKLAADNEPYPMANKDVLFDFRDNEKTEFEIMQLSGHIAINSILGKKPHCKTNKGHILARMFGYVSIKAMPETLPPVINELYKKYSTRYHFDKLIKHLFAHWHIITYSRHIRGMWIGKYSEKRPFDISLQEMIKEAESKKMSNKIKMMNQEKEKTRKNVIDELNKRYTSNTQHKYY